jgi:hypothetical protein
VGTSKKTILTMKSTKNMKKKKLNFKSFMLFMVKINGIAGDLTS